MFIPKFSKSSLIVRIEVIELWFFKVVFWHHVKVKAIISTENWSSLCQLCNSLLLLLFNFLLLKFINFLLSCLLFKFSLVKDILLISLFLS